MEREMIGTFRIESDERRLRAAECPKYDTWVDVKAGEYPVYLYKEHEGIGRVYMALVTFDDLAEIWYGFQLATCEKFTPANGWKVDRYTFRSSYDGHEIESGYIVRAEKGDSNGKKN